ncbi:MAG: DEAD/DEAH box helicase, partial [Syntrophales bacterium]|nr:DEAD/DEAH box helicase [Syntrophales bacterium]
MIHIDEILAKIEQPLSFASRDDFRRLSTIRNLEPVLTNLLGKLTTHLSQQGLLSPPVDEALKAMQRAILRIDSLGEEAKKERIINMTELLKVMRDRLDPGVNTGDTRNAFPVAHHLERLRSSVQFVRGVGPKMAVLLDRKNIRTVEDLLYFLPRTYEDRRKMKKIAGLFLGRRETVIGQITEAGMKRHKSRRTFEITVGDGTGHLRATWFSGNQSYLSRTFTVGKTVVLSGEVRLFGGMFSMVHPDFEIIDEGEDNCLNFQRIVPVYSETAGLHQKTIRRIIRRALDEYLPQIPDVLPESIRRRRQLPALSESIEACHFPPPTAEIAPFLEGSSRWHRHLVYDECFFFALGLAVKKAHGALEEGIALRRDGEGYRAFLAALPFPLTTAQRRVIEEIVRDMERPYPMNRLLQGDVGSGKTVVAAAAMLMACDNGYQAALMAPTEILAEQHHRNICQWMAKVGVETVLLTGTTKGRHRRRILDDIATGATKIIVGTHALIQEDVRFGALGLA